MNLQSHMATWKQKPAYRSSNNRHQFHFLRYNRLDMKQAWASVSFCVELISWLLLVHMALFFLDRNPRKERAAITGGLSSLAMLTTPLMAVMQLTGLLSVSTKGDSRSAQRLQGGKQKNAFLHDCEDRLWNGVCLRWKVLLKTNANQMLSFSLQSWTQMVGFPGKRVHLVLKACWWVCSQTERWGRGSSTAGSAKPCLSPLCQLSTLGYISAL